LLEIADVQADGQGFVGFSNGKLTWEEARQLAARVGAEVVAMEGTPERSAPQLADWLTEKFPSLHGSTVWVRQHGREKMCDLPDVLPVTSLLRRRHALFEWKNSKPLKLPRWQAPDGAEFVTIPGGLFEMGDALDGDGNAPMIRLNVSPFRLQTTETTKAQWDDVRVWGLLNGYTDLSEGEGKAATHPVQKVNWHDVVKWLNARSEMHQLKPCYSAEGAVYRTGMAEAVSCDWEADGYRLPTEAEWERAARGPSFGRRYPWGYTISHREANFRNDGREPYRNGTAGFHPNHRGTAPSTSPVARFPANDFGLFDVTGNVWEWCWDWYDRNYYQDSDGSTDPRGPEIGNHRVLRGGSWYSHAYYTRCAIRIWLKPESPLGNRGFRPARREGGGQAVLVPRPAMEIALYHVAEPAKLLREKDEITMPATAGEPLRIRLSAVYRKTPGGKLYSNLLLAGELAPERLDEMNTDRSYSWHFDTASHYGRLGRNHDLSDTGTITYEIKGYAPSEPGIHKFELNLGLTSGEGLVKIYTVTLNVTPPP
jgi:formylglycine-generating enzyme required for sulfatase activity